MRRYHPAERGKKPPEPEKLSPCGVERFIEKRGYVRTRCSEPGFKEPERMRSVRKRMHLAGDSEVIQFVYHRVSAEMEPLESTVDECNRWSLGSHMSDRRCISPASTFVRRCPCCAASRQGKRRRTMKADLMKHHSFFFSSGEGAHFFFQAGYFSITRAGS